MINIIMNRDIVKELVDKRGYYYIESPFKRYATVINIKDINSEIRNIVNTIESCGLDQANNIISKFTDKPISLDEISDGSKTTIYVYYRTEVLKEKEIINITNCGSNAIAYILKHYSDANLTLFLGHFEIPRNIECTFKLNGELLTNTNAIFE